MERRLTSKEVAAMVGAGCGVETVRKAFRLGHLAGTPLGRGYGFTERDVEAWLQALRREASVSPLRIDATQTPRSAARRSKAS